MSARIPISEGHSEIGELASVLNETFASLESAFERQARFTADASHELRTPTFVILVQSQSALKRERSAEEYRRGFEVCQAAAKQMRALIESLLFLARRDASNVMERFQACQLERIVQDVVCLLGGLAGRKKVILNAQSTPVEVFGDPQQLKQVVTNLVANAIEYSHPGAEVLISLYPHESEVVLSVTDTGVGISEKDLPHVFERFYRADDARSSKEGHTGLGLAICDAIVRAHEGRIEVRSILGSGTIFAVKLPLLQGGGS